MSLGVSMPIAQSINVHNATDRNTAKSATVPRTWTDDRLTQLSVMSFVSQFKSIQFGSIQGYKRVPIPTCVFCAYNISCKETQYESLALQLATLLSIWHVTCTCIVCQRHWKQEAQLLVRDRATRKPAKDCWNSIYHVIWLIPSNDFQGHQKWHQTKASDDFLLVLKTMNECIGVGDGGTYPLKFGKNIFLAIIM